MLTRRHIRIKVFQTLYSFFQNDKKQLDVIQKNVLNSCNQIQHLYVMILSVFVEVLHHSRIQIEKNKQKRLPTEQDLNPNLKFVNNKLLKLIEENTTLKKVRDVKKINWLGHHGELIRNFYRTLIISDAYKNYMQEQSDDFEQDRAIILYLFEQIIATSEPLYAITDEQNMYWHDDIDFVNTLIFNTLSIVNVTNKESFLVPLAAFKSEQDEQFFKKLLKHSLSLEEQSVKDIKALADNWDYDRIALSDRILMMMAFTEFQKFDSIPTKASINEYLDLAKLYSTEKSHVFLNGILDKATKKMKSENRLLKHGRGLL